MEIITRYSGLKSRAREIQEYISEVAEIRGTEDNIKQDFPESDLASRVSKNLSGCCNYLVFHNYYTIDQTRLVKAVTCKQHLVCPFCAARRAAKNMTAYSEKIEQVTSENKTLKPVMITMTVKNGHDLEERFDHLKASMSRLIERRRDYLKKGRGQTEFRKIDGAMYSVEFTHNPESGWHPHVHMIALVHDWIDREALSREWENVTGDSKIIDVRLIKNKKINSEKSDLISGLAEVLKYALKFSDLDNSKVWEAYKSLKTKRLMATFGSLWGVKVPEKLTDDPLENLPFIELFYKYEKSKKHFDLKTSTPFSSLDEKEKLNPRSDSAEVKKTCSRGPADESRRTKVSSESDWLIAGNAYPNGCETTPISSA